MTTTLKTAVLLLEKTKTLTPADLIAPWKFLANDCSLVVISTPDLEAAYRIFAVLNNRGLDLAQGNRVNSFSTVFCLFPA